MQRKHAFMFVDRAVSLRGARRAPKASIAAMWLVVSAVLGSSTAHAQDPAAPPRPTAPAARKAQPRAAAKPKAQQPTSPGGRDGGPVPDAKESPEVSEAPEAQASLEGQEQTDAATDDADAVQALPTSDGETGTVEPGVHGREPCVDDRASPRAAAPPEPDARATRASHDARRVPPPGVRTYGDAAPASAPAAWWMPEEMDYTEGADIPPGYVKDTRVRKGLVIAGAVTFGTTWLLSSLAATAMIDGDEQQTAYDQYQSGGSVRREEKGIPDAAALYIPLVGPFVAIRTLHAEGGGTAMLLLDGVAQIAGFSMFVAGLAAKRTVLVRSPEATLALAPASVGAHAGTSLVGSF